MKKSACINSTQTPLFAAMPLLFGLVTFVAAPAAEAVTIDSVNLIQGYVDVNQDGLIDGADDLNNVIFWFDEAAPVRVDITNGEIDVNEGGSITTLDDLNNVDLNDENTVNGVNGVPSKNQVDFRDGSVDVDEDGVLHEIGDDALVNVQLFIF
ncbi:hypothetical protein [Methyloglobulus sp.]|uniref:hypothetical protein n=1 Tax=Methyloglobulus sp. TaxID=2518622 RepID=UPI0032B8787B